MQESKSKSPRCRLYTAYFILSMVLHVYRCSPRKKQDLFSLSLSFSISPRKGNNKFTPRDIIIMLKGMNRKKKNKNRETMQIYI